MNFFSPETRRGARNGVLTAIYIGLVVTFMQNASRVFGARDVPYLTPFMAITLFVVSALITGSLVLWTPARLLVDGKKTEASATLFAAGATLAGVLAIALAVAFLVR